MTKAAARDVVHALAHAGLTVATGESLTAGLLAARLADAPEYALGLAGQGVRDTTRIAHSDPELWVQILGANAAPVVAGLDALAADLAELSYALRDVSRRGALRDIAETIRWVASLPKHVNVDTLSIMPTDQAER